MKTTGQFSSLIAAAETLRERLDSRIETGGNQPVDYSLINYWREGVFHNDENTFRKRLTWDGISERQAAQLLSSPAAAKAQQQLPPWALLLKSLLIEIDNPTKARQPEFYDFCKPGKPLPFEDFLAKFVLLGRSMLRKTSQISSKTLLPGAMTDLEHGLLKRLTHIATATLFHEFSQFKAANQSDGARSCAYQDYIAHLHRDGATALFEKYPIMARMLCEVVTLWTEAVTEFLRRIENDLPEIQDKFAGKSETGKISGILYGLSDHHQGGRTVFRLTFENGLRLIYKPKDISIEQKFYHLLHWLNANGAPLPFKTLRILERPGYGWVEFIETKPCKDLQAVERYYRRCGMLMFVLYSLGGTDFHNENIIACSDQPMAIDLETLFHHRVDGAADSEYSLLDLQFLPQRSGTQPGAGFDISGIGVNASPELVIKARRIVNINTAEMAIGFVELRKPPASNTVFFNDAPCTAVNYRRQVIEGFQSLYQLFIKQRSRLLAVDGPLNAFAGLPTRLIFLDTQRYARIMHQALQPQFLRNGILYGLQLEKLYRRLLSADEKPAYWPIVRHEITDIARMDIPKFSSRSDSTIISLPDGSSISGCLATDSFQKVKQRITSLKEADLSQQCQIIATTLTDVAGIAYSVDVGT